MSLEEVEVPVKARPVEPSAIQVETLQPDGMLTAVEAATAVEEVVDSSVEEIEMPIEVTMSAAELVMGVASVSVSETMGEAMLEADSVA